jgi:hypothetical protein
MSCSKSIGGSSSIRMETPYRGRGRVRGRTFGHSEPKPRFDCLINRMSRIACLVAVSVLLVKTLFSQQTSELVAFNTLLTNPKPYAGQTIALHGFVESQAVAGFELSEAQNSGAKAKAEPSQLRAAWMKDATKISLQKAQEVVVIGQIQVRDNTPILHVANIITDKDAIRRFTRPSERRPRPGDNLGHDAQPSTSLSN